MTMRPYQIHAIRAIDTIRSVARMSHYTFNPRKRAHWLQRLCLWTLDCLECGAYEEVVTTRHITIDPDKFMQRILDQHDGLIERQREPRTILIGTKDYDQLMGEITSDVNFGFQAEYAHSRTLMGLNVQVVPWMKGILILPWVLTRPD